MFRFVGSHTFHKFVEKIQDQYIISYHETKVVMTVSNDPTEINIQFLALSVYYFLHFSSTFWYASGFSESVGEGTKVSV